MVTSIDHRGARSRRLALALVFALVVALSAGIAPASATPSEGSAAAVRVKAPMTDRQRAEPMPLLELVSSSGSGRLYTMSSSEAQGAVRNGMTRQPGYVGFLPRFKVDGTIALHRLKPSSDATRWLMTASVTERTSLTARGWVDEGVVGFVYANPADGTTPLLRFNNGKEWRVAVEARRAELVAAGYRAEGVIGYVHETWARVGAVYFGMWHPGGSHVVEPACERFYGRRDIWCGVREFHDGDQQAAETWPEADFTWLKPALGYYDDSQVQTLEAHIDQATSAGLSFFNFYAYWDSGRNEESLTAEAIDAFLQADNRDEIDFTVGLCAHPYAPLAIPASQFGGVAEALVGTYLSQPNTLRTNDGRKILNICDARGIGDGSVAQISAFIQAVRAEAVAGLGEDVYVMINQAGFDPRKVPAVGADGAYCTTDGPGIASQSYATYLAGQRAYFAKAPGEYARCALSGFDERTRYPMFKSDPDSVRWFRDYEGHESFRASVRNVRVDLAASTRPATIDNLVYVFAWNEWREGGVVEPNERDGCAYLDVIRDGLDLTSGEGCVHGGATTPATAPAAGSVADSGPQPIGPTHAPAPSSPGASSSAQPPASTDADPDVAKQPTRLTR